MLLADRVAASSFAILFGMLGEKSFPGVGAVAGTLRATPAMGPELGRLARGALPDPMVARLSSGTPAVVEVADRLARAAAAYTGPARSASGPDLVTALGHLPTHAAIMCVGTPVTAVEAYRYVAQLDRALGHDGSALTLPRTLPRLIVNDGELEFLCPRLVSDEIESDTDARIAFVMSVLRETTAASCPSACIAPSRAARTRGWQCDWRVQRAISTTMVMGDPPNTFGIGFGLWTRRYKLM